MAAIWSTSDAREAWSAASSVICASKMANLCRPDSRTIAACAARRLRHCCGIVHHSTHHKQEVCAEDSRYRSILEHHGGCLVGSTS